MTIAVVRRPPAISADQDRESWAGRQPLAPRPGLRFHAVGTVGAITWSEARFLALATTVWLLIATGNAAAQSAPMPPSLVEAGLGKGVTIRSTDDRASLNIRARIQVRSTVIGHPDDREDLSEIAIRRLRLVFQGNAAGPALTYYVQLAFANLDTETDLRLPLRDAYVTWTPARALHVRLGQMKVPFSRQRVTSSSALQMVDRSIVVTELNLDRDVGVQMFSKDLLGIGALGYALGVFGGEGRNRPGRAAGLLYSARLEAWPLGSFDDTVEGDVLRGQPWRIALGSSVAYNQNTNRPLSTIGTPYPAGDVGYAHAGVDAIVKKRGWSLLSELMFRRAARDAQTVVVNGASTTIQSRSGWGAYVQGGRMVTNRLEISARYSRLLPSSGTDPTFVSSRELGGGLSYYINRHDLKIQGDYFRVTDPATARGVHQGRVHFQLFF